jgi:hypothetical protein
MQAVAEPRGMQDAADDEFGAGILALDAGHDPRTLLRRKQIGHRLPAIQNLMV